MAYKRGYKRKSSGKRRKSNRSGMSERLTSRIASAISTYSNPFSNGTINPKIPDGKASWSLGVRNSPPITSLQCTANKDYIYLFPGMTSCLSVVTNVAAAANPTSAQITEGTVDFDPAAPANLTQWRVVSCGMKVMCTSAVGSNDGYFEAVRANSATVNTVTPAAMLSHPSYQTGKIRDIGRYLFQLKPQGRDHDFRSGGTGSDVQYDMIIIKLSAGATAQLVIQAIQNAEYVVDEADAYARFQTPCIPAEYSLKKAQDRLMSNIMPGKVVSY